MNSTCRGFGVAGRLGMRVGSRVLALARRRFPAILLALLGVDLAHALLVGVDAHAAAERAADQRSLAVAADEVAGERAARAAHEAAFFIGAERVRAGGNGRNGGGRDHCYQAPDHRCRLLAHENGARPAETVSERIAIPCRT